MTSPSVIVGMSGGVDSSVAALLLQRANVPIAGMFMQNWEEDDRQGPCRADADRKDALAVCARLGIPLHMRNFAAEYWDSVFAHFLDEYRAGRTPNPDVLCNREIKFKTFLEHARALGADRIATGHYARVDRVDGRWRLLRARDDAKDQSYFLHALQQDALSATLFPVGELAKPEVRSIAREAMLPVHAKKDSTGICFIGERDFRAFLGEYIPAQSGEIRTPEGATVGEHAGVFFYTLGQRGGLGIGGRKGSSGEPWYVVGKDPSRNALIVDQGHDSPHLFATALVADEASFVAGAAPADEFRCTAKIRYRQLDQPCSVRCRTDGTVEARFDHPQRAVTPGQSVVFYDRDECLGGAIIAASDSTYGGLGG